nr:MAK10-like protein [Tanacetum cinerariifolium]
MGDENAIRTLGDYSKPNHDGYRNTIELPVGNNVVPLRSDTIRLVQNGCSFYGLRLEDPNQHLKDFLKLVESLNLDGENKERTRLYLFEISLRDQASNWLERLPAGSITTWEDLTTRFLAQFFPPALLEDLALYDNESWNDLKDFVKPVKAIALPQDVPSTSDCRLIELENQVQRLMEAHLALTRPTQVNKITTSCDTQYCMEDPAQAFIEYASSRTDKAGDARLSKFEADFKKQQSEMTNKIDTMLKAITDRISDPRLFTLPFRLWDSKPFDTLADLGSCVNIIPLYLFKKFNIGLLEETDHIFGLADETKSYLVGIVKDVEVHIGKLKVLNDLYVIDMKKDPETPLLVGRGFLATANAVIDCRMDKIAAGERITKSVFEVKWVDLGKEEEISRDAELNPFKDTLVFRRTVKFLGAIPINLKSNMWESKDLIKNPINWDKPPKNRDGAWHAKIRLIDPDGEEFTKNLQSIPTTKKLSERESPREIIDLDHFYDT